MELDHEDERLFLMEMCSLVVKLYIHSLASVGFFETITKWNEADCKIMNLTMKMKG
jgi:hypothetical protein